MSLVALHPEGVDRNESLGNGLTIRFAASPSTRRAWIEIMPLYHAAGRRAVALHPEGVDRNFVFEGRLDERRVALHPEGVDRNAKYASDALCSRVALHPEGVDRNITFKGR